LAADSTLVPGSTVPAAGGLDGELKALRDKAGRICEELPALYRRMDELQQQIQAHQQR
jgi:prefoldin subunit 5